MERVPVSLPQFAGPYLRAESSPVVEVCSGAGAGGVRAAACASEWEGQGQGIPFVGPEGRRDVMSSTEPWTEESWNTSLSSAYTLVPPSALIAAAAAAASSAASAAGAAGAAGTQAAAAAGVGAGTGGASFALVGGDDLWNVTGLLNVSRGLNGTAPQLPNFCDNWEAIQHSLYQVANLFFCLAFLVPRHFKQSVLLYRFMLAVGCLLTSIWASFHLCALDVFAWNTAMLVVNAAHTITLIVRFLPPALSPELTELYLKVFRPLKVSKKAFKELAREGTVEMLDPGEKYAEEDHTPADERLSILLRGKLSVTCDGTHLHHINVHQFVDSPEWEANHDTSESTFQVTISAVEESVFLCWPRMKLSRVLRHRPQVRIVLDTLIGKDITHKLYSLNEQMMGASDRQRQANSDHWRKTMSRSLSVDAVNTGTRGHVRSSAFKTARRERTTSALTDTKDLLQSPVNTRQAQCWIPLVANHFPAMSPFTDAQGQPQPLTTAAATATTLPLPLGSLGPMGTMGTTAPAIQLQQVPSSMALVPVPVIVPVLAPPPTLHQARSRTMRRAGAGTGAGAGAGAGTGPGAVKFEATPV